MDKALLKKMQQCCQHSLKALDQDLAKVNKQLDDLIAWDEELNRLFNLITSIEGIGAVTAREGLITGRRALPMNLKILQKLKDMPHRRSDCYAGVVPFQHCSGSSVKRKTRVSHLANKTAAGAR